MQIGLGQLFQRGALIDRLRRWVGVQVELVGRSAARLIGRGRLPIRSGGGVLPIADPVAAGPAALGDYRAAGPPADWLERVRRGAPELLVPGRVPTLRVPGWTRPGAPRRALPASDCSLDLPRDGGDVGVGASGGQARTSIREKTGIPGVAVG
jgi:hypothetical protein